MGSEMCIRDRWETIDQEATDSDLWDLEWFAGKLYISTLHALYWLNGDQLELVDFGELIPNSCHSLSSADGLLWSIGENDILAFDGTSWARVE